MSSIFNNIRTLGNVAIGGNLVVSGNNTAVDSEIVQISDNHIYLNKNYETNVAQTGGLVVNVEPQEATAATVIGLGFSTTTKVDVDNAIGIFTAGDFIQVSGSNNADNDGAYEVASFDTTPMTGVVTVGVGSPNVVGTGTLFTTELSVNDWVVIEGETHQVQTITDDLNIVLASNHSDGATSSAIAIAGPGLNIKSTLTAPNDFTLNGFVADGTTGATITRVRLSILRAGIDGAWETATGTTTTGLVFSDLISAADSTAHSDLTGLTSGDDHTQYVLLVGRTGGQSIIGSTDTSENLTLTPNSASTNGAVIIASSTDNATSKDTGALIVADGGLGVELNMFAGGSITTDTGFVGTGLDAATAVGIAIGGTTATTLSLGRTTQTIDILGQLDVEGTIDATSAVDISIGGTVATGVDISRTGRTTTILGPLKVAEATTFEKPFQHTIVDDASTTAQTPGISALNPVTRFTGTSDFTYTLPAVGATEDGMTLTFYKSSASGTITLATAGATTGGIEGGTITLTTQYDRFTIIYVNSDSRWIIV